MSERLGVLKYEESATTKNSKSESTESFKFRKTRSLKVFRVSLSERLGVLRVLRISDSRLDSKMTLMTLYTCFVFFPRVLYGLSLSDFQYYLFLWYMHIAAYYNFYEPLAVLHVYGRVSTQMK